MKIIYFVLSLLFFGIFYSGCKEVFEEELKGKYAVLTTPKADFETTIATHTFWWEEIEGANKYNLQIATPSFGTNIQSLMLDTTVGSNQFTHTLSAGAYQWRVRAENSAYAGEYSTRNLFINSSPDLSEQIMILASPSEGIATNASSITFKWLKMAAADDYRLEIKSPDFNTGSPVINPLTATADSAVINTLADGFYQWGVRAQNATSNTQVYFRNIIVDRIAPNAPTLSRPFANDTLAHSNFDYKWFRGFDSGSSIHDSLLVFADTTNSIFNPIIATSLTDSTFSNVDSLANGDYFWLIKSIDAAGNQSGDSPIRKFNILKL